MRGVLSTKLWLLKQHTETTILAVFECNLLGNSDFTGTMKLTMKLKQRPYWIGGLFRPITADIYSKRRDLTLKREQRSEREEAHKVRVIFRRPIQKK